jgi:entericidin B
MKLFAVCMMAMGLLLAGCNTVEGIGKDIKKGGEAIEKSEIEQREEKSGETRQNMP